MVEVAIFSKGGIDYKTLKAMPISELDQVSKAVKKIAARQKVR
jgi:hypothetical protein